MSALTGLECPECGKAFDADRLQTICRTCNSPLLARYDVRRLTQEIDRDRLAEGPAGIWRWYELLPVRDLTYRYALGEGDTPLLPAPRLASELGLDHLFVKDEGSNPTGTFKARGLSVAVSRAAELKVRDFVIPTAGNAGGALAAYAAKAKLSAHVFMPQDAPPVNQAEVIAFEANLTLVEGFIDEAGRQAAQGQEANGWFNVSTFKEPYRLEGKKTMGYELAEAFDWRLPEVIIYPTGGGTGLVGMWKAFQELEALGWIGSDRPRMVSVQASGCAPIVRALEEGAERAKKWKEPFTQAHGLRVPSVFADRLILEAVRESDGIGVSVSEDEIKKSQRALAQKEGLLACPEGAATLAGLVKLVETGWVNPDERVVLFNTGSGLKYL